MKVEIISHDKIRVSRFSIGESAKVEVSTWQQDPNGISVEGAAGSWKLLTLSDSIYEDDLFSVDLNEVLNLDPGMGIEIIEDEADFIQRKEIFDLEARRKLEEDLIGNEKKVDVAEDS